MRAYDEIVRFLTSGPTLEQILEFEPSSATQQRVRQLMDDNRAGYLSSDEKFELDEYARVSHFVQSLKQRAERRLHSV